METTQSYSSHARIHPLYHFFTAPILIGNVIVALVWLVLHPGWMMAWLFAVSVALMLLAFFVRTNPLKLQDRVIRLEERLRMAALLSEPLKSRIHEVSEKQLIALRFASDDELETLVAETLEKNLSPKDIKKKIQNWRPDHWRV